MSVAETLSVEELIDAVATATDRNADLDGSPHRIAYSTGNGGSNAFEYAVVRLLADILAELRLARKAKGKP